jgi:uncharacterized protein (DUF58 family)
VIVPVLRQTGKRLAHRLGRFGRRRSPAGEAALHQPLLEAGELSLLVEQARHLPLSLRALEVHEHHAGDWPSCALGRGLDFEEARPYAPGDDLRDMDWRSTARLGHAYVKTYREERQPLWHVVVDHGPGMRFGTRRRLKAAQASRLGTLLAAAANQRGIAVGCTVWGRDDLHLPARHSEQGMLELVDAMIAPCPPLPGSASRGDGLAERLHRLRANLPRGAHVWLLTDAHDAGPEAARALGLLAVTAHLHLVWITDPVERELPALGRVEFEDRRGSVLTVDTADAALRERWAHTWASRRAAWGEQLARHGLRPLELDTAEEDLPRWWSRTVLPVLSA